MKPKPSSAEVEKSGAVPSLPHMPSECAKGQLYHSPLQIKSRAKSVVVDIHLMNFIFKITLNKTALPRLIN
jgi:hypothetical protein